MAAEAVEAHLAVAVCLAAEVCLAAAVSKISRVCDAERGLARWMTPRR